jgi:hypothetical protein
VRFHHSDPAAGVEIYDYATIIVYQSGETESELCGYDDLIVVDGTQFYYPRQYMVGPVEGDSAKFDGWKKMILIDTVIEYPEEFSSDCRKEIYRTLEMKWTSGLWESIWNEHEDVTQTVGYYIDDFEGGTSTYVEETYGNDGSVRLEIEGDLTWLVIEIDHDEFVTEGQVMFETDDSTITIEMMLCYRDADGNVIEDLTQMFELSVIDTAVEEVTECQYMTLGKKTGARYDQVAYFPGEAPTSDPYGDYDFYTYYDSMAHFEIYEPLRLDWNALEDSGCYASPIFELYVMNQETSEYRRFREQWEEFSQMHSYLESHFDFDKSTGNFFLSFNYEEFQEY